MRRVLRSVQASCFCWLALGRIAFGQDVPDPDADRLLRERWAKLSSASQRADGAESFARLDAIVPPIETRTPADVAVWSDFARDAAELGRRSLAWRGWRAVLARDPDHKDARRILGFVPHQGGWATPWAVAKLKAGQVDHPRYGWVPKGWIEHLDQGELPGKDGRGWLAADQADQARSAPDLADPWEITTEHFLIRSNLPLDEAIAIVRDLETFHELFVGMLADVLGERVPLARRLRDPEAVPPGAGRGGKHEVFYFAAKADFVGYLRSRHRIEAADSLGVYLTAADMGRRSGAGASFFFQDDQAEIPTRATLFHEVSHQLLFETGGRSRFRPADPGYWTMEGLGTYFETLQIDEKQVTIGARVGPRLEAARIRLVERGEAVPMQQLAAMDREQFHAAKAVHLHYAQAMAAAVLLINGHAGRDREPFLDYVRDLTEGRARRASDLATRLDRSWEELDRDLIVWLRP